jgi:hypothetical protein
MMDWTPFLEPLEHVRWEGRPAPRCYTFRKWRLSVYGLLLLLLSVFFFVISIPFGEFQGRHFVAFFPIPFILLGIYLSVGQVLLARREWEHVFYAVTDRRILVQRGIWRSRVETMPLEEALCFIYRPLGRELGSFLVRGGAPRPPLALLCIEHPQPLALLLEEALASANHVGRIGQPAGESV